MATKSKKEIEYLCTDCGNTTPKWVGKCPFCGAWNTLKEHAVEHQPEAVGRSGRGLGGPVHQVVLLKDVATEDTRRLSTANSEFDRVLGGGLAPGSLVRATNSLVVKALKVSFEYSFSVLIVHSFVKYTARETVRTTSTGAPRLHADYLDEGTVPAGPWHQKTRSVP